MQKHKSNTIKKLIIISCILLGMITPFLFESVLTNEYSFPLELLETNEDNCKEREQELKQLDKFYNPNLSSHICNKLPQKILSLNHTEYIEDHIIPIIVPPPQK